MSTQNKRVVFISYSLMCIYAIALYFLTYNSIQSSFSNIVITYSIMFSTYLLLYYKIKISKVDWIVLLMVSLVIILPSLPNLSDDIYRYYWDGVLSTNQISPYKYLPSEVLEIGITRIDTNLYDQLNSQHYYSIYPLTSQLLFWFSALVSSNIISFSITIRLMYILLAAIGIKYGLKFCKENNYNEKLIFLFYCNPLVITEGFVNLHTELISSSLLLIFLYYINQKSLKKAILPAALAISTKLNPAIIFIFYIFNKRLIVRLLMPLLLLTILFMLPIILGVSTSNFLSSIDLYFRKFEFNASIYYVLRYLGNTISGYNLIWYIGPFLAILAFALIVYKAKQIKNGTSTVKLIEFSFYSYFIYLLLSTTIHPWYIIHLLLFGVFLNKKSAIAWSYLIVLTYINYSYPQYQENLLVVTFEYTIVMIFLFYDQIKKPFKMN